MNEFLKTLIEKYKPNVSRDRLFSGYDINVDDRSRIKSEVTNYLNEHFKRPDIKSKEYHDYYKEMLILKEVSETFDNYVNNLRYCLPFPKGTDVYQPQRD